MPSSQRPGNASGHCRSASNLKPKTSSTVLVLRKERMMNTKGTTLAALEHIPPASNRGIPKGLRMSESGALDSFWKDRVMAKPYSDDLRVRAIAIVEGGASRHEVAALLE